MSEQKQDKAADWSKIEADYRAGVKSLRQIAADHGITEGAIRKRAKKEDWERDLAAKVQAKAEAIVRRESVRNEVREKSRVPEVDVISDNAEAVAAVMLSERRDIQRGRKLVMSLLGELEQTTDNKDLFEKLGALMFNPDKYGNDKLNDTYHKVISMAGRVDSMKKLSDALKTLVGLEREAFGIGQDCEKGGTFEDFVDQLT